MNRQYNGWKNIAVFVMILILCIPNVSFASGQKIKIDSSVSMTLDSSFVYMGNNNGQISYSDINSGTAIVYTVKNSTVQTDVMQEALRRQGFLPSVRTVNGLTLVEGYKSGKIAVIFNTPAKHYVIFNSSYKNSTGYNMLVSAINSLRPTSGSDSTDPSDPEQPDESTDGIDISKKNFPDAVFRNYVKQFDKDGNGSLSNNEITAVDDITIQHDKLSDLRGIEFFTELIFLDCDDNNLKELDVSNNLKLQGLWCSNNKLTHLDVSKNTCLTKLCCWNNQLTRLDVSKNIRLIDLECNNNQLANLDVSKNTQLTVLYCWNNHLTRLDVSKNTLLTDLECNNNQLTSLDVSKNTQLAELYCWNNQLTKLDVSKIIQLTDLECNNNQLTSLDVSNNTKLTKLFCWNNHLTRLDVSKNTQLTDLDCGINALTSLDVSKNTKLNILYCGDNHLTSLNISKNTRMSDLNCSKNQIPSLNVSENTQLIRLICWNNKLTSLDVSHNTKLNQLNCNQNSISQLDIRKCKSLIKLTKASAPSSYDDYNYGWWTINSSGEIDNCLFIDKSTEVITGSNNDDDDILITELKLNKTKVTLKKGETIELKVKKFIPSNATNKKVLWSTSNKNVATVSANGKVKAVGKGTCIITCTAKDGGGAKATCKIKVK